ncbi:hypothetical protein GTQ48_03035 [Alteromonas genovensis]|uniref:Uncharacterized protein n=1 Tax=Alteromonas genovensis TaxID=471225 RepID=A0A6N9TB33_9ALTE|nr:carbohydrate porin [Alteromonas genovensis]NDW14507.1 hypothetical protein [Alteromonas genovensis]
MASCFCAANTLANSLSLTLVHDTSYVASGGLEERTTINRTLGIVAYEYRINDSTLIFADAQVLRGNNGSDSVGDLQAFSNIDEAELTKMYEVWVEKSFYEESLRFKIGQVDANNEFAYAEHAGEFIHSSMGFSPTVSYFPTYPSPRLSVNAFYSATQNTQLSIGHYANQNRSFSNGFTVGQWTQHIGNVTAAIGGWMQSGDIAPLVENEVDESMPPQDASGLFATLSGEFGSRLFAAQNGSWFMQYGQSSDTTSEIDTHIGAGITWYGMNNRKDDVLGLGISHITTSPLVASQYKRDETAIELFYRFQLTDNLALKPDIQFIANPAEDREAKDALVLTMRVELSI